MTLEELEKRTGISYENASSMMRLAMAMTCLRLEEDDYNVQD